MTSSSPTSTSPEGNTPSMTGYRKTLSLLMERISSADL